MTLREKLTIRTTPEERREETQRQRTGERTLPETGIETGRFRMSRPKVQDQVNYFRK